MRVLRLGQTKFWKLTAVLTKTIAKLFKTAKKSLFPYQKSRIKSLLLPSKIFQVMARVCQVTDKTPIGGNKVSHSNIKTKRRFLPNLQTKKFFLAEEKKWITLKLTTDAIRTINKNGLYNVVKELRAQGQHI